MEKEEERKAHIRAAYEALRRPAWESWEEFHRLTSSYILVGTATCGRAAGALEVRNAFAETTRQLGLTVPVLEVGCMGHCYAEPLAVVKKPGWPAMVYHHLNPIIAWNLVRLFFLEDDPYLDIFLGAVEQNELGLPTLSDLPRFGREARLLLQHCGFIDPLNIDHALAVGAYEGLVRVLTKPREEGLAMIQAARLRGLGGAGFPTWQKWKFLREAAGPRYVLCNADEGDPGAFMDRTLLESDPHAVLEGLIIAGYLAAAGGGFIYVRAEYPRAVSVFRQAVAQARQRGLLGANILESGFAFEVEVVEGAGAFICGEETALLASIEGRRGMPQVRPPYPTERGLFGQPTAVNNVKTLAHTAHICREGPERFASLGGGASRGTAVFALAGKIANPGLVEVPMGITLRELLFEIGGGIPGGKAFKAVQIGGPSGGCLPEALLDTPIDFDSLEEAGAIMGSGGMVVMDEDNCMVDAARYFLEFTQHESCGKCTFCRIGTWQMLQHLDRISRGEGELSDLASLQTLAEDIKAGSLCNLGRTAVNPVLTALRYFRQEFEAHLVEKRCPAAVCRELIAYYIDTERCARGCDACVGSCPVEAVYEDSRHKKVVDQSLCVRCDSCLTACPPEYRAVRRISPRHLVPAVEPRPDKKTGGSPESGTPAGA